MKIILISIVIVVFSINAMAISKQSLETAGVSEQQLIEVFNVAVFGVEKDLYLSKWEDSEPMVVYLTGSGTNEQALLFNEQMEKIIDVACIKIQSRGEDGKFNVLFNVTNTPFFDALTRFSPVFEEIYDSRKEFLTEMYTREREGVSAYANWLRNESNKQLVSAAIVTPNDPDEFQVYLGYMLMLLLGFGHSNDIKYPLSDTLLTSMIVSDKRDGQLTELDLLLIKILYDSRLKSGMTFREAQPIIENIVDELMD